MGNFGAKNNLNKQEENPDNTQANIVKNNNTNEIFEKNETVSSNEENKMNDNPISEKEIKISPAKQDNFTKISKSICQLEIENKLSNTIETNMGTGFLLKFWIDLDIFNCLISNEQMITRNIVDNISNNIIIKYDNELKKINIKLDKNKRYIKNFNDIGLDITVVEVLDEDNIHDDYFLWAEPEDFVKNNDLIKSNIYIPQYSQEKN